MAAEMCGDLRGKTGDPCCGSNMDSHPVASAGENKANLKGVGQVKHARTLTGKHTRTLTCLHTHTHTHTHTQEPTHGLLIALTKGAQAAHSIGKMTYSKA